MWGFFVHEHLPHLVLPAWFYCSNLRLELQKGSLLVVHMDPYCGDEKTVLANIMTVSNRTNVSQPYVKSR